MTQSAMFLVNVTSHTTIQNAFYLDGIKQQLPYKARILSKAMTSLNFEPNKNYLVEVIFKEWSDVYGLQFTYKNRGEVKTTEFLDTKRSLDLEELRDFEAFLTLTEKQNTGNVNADLALAKKQDDDDDDPSF